MGNKKCYVSILLFLIGTVHLCFAQQHKIDSLKQSIIQTSSDSIRIATHYKIGQLYENEPDSSLVYLNKGLKISKQINHQYLKQEGLNLLADHWYYKGNLNEALNTIELAQKVNVSNQHLQTTTYIILGKIVSELGQHKEAVTAYLKAIRLGEAVLDTTNLIIANTNLANVYRYLGQRKEALMLYHKSLEMSKLTKNRSYEASNLGNIGIIYRNQGQLEKALEFYTQSLDIHREMGQRFHVAIDLMNLGVLYENLEQFNKAKASHFESNKISKALKDDIGVVLTFINLGIIESKTKNFKRGLMYYDSAMVLSKKMEYKEGFKHYYLAKSETYSLMKNHEAAYTNRLLFEQWKDTLENENHLNAISELEIKYETEKKENELLKLNKQKQEDDIVISNQNRKVKQLSLGLGVAILLGLLAFLLFKQRLQNKKQNELLLAISETQTAERKRISQDLHDSIGGSLALTKNKLQNALDKIKTTSPEMDEAILALNNTSNQVRQISHNLMPGELVRFGLVPAINTLLEQLDAEELHAQLYTTQMKNRIEPLTEIQLYRIVQEAIQNVIKHAKAKNLYIHLNRHKKHLSLIIEDDGIGMLPNIKEGLGLKNIEQRIKMLNGSFTADSSENKGTTLNIQIPM